MPFKTRPGSRNSIDNMISTQPNITPQYIGSLNHARFWSDNLFVYQYSDYCYIHLIRITLYAEKPHTKGAYDRLEATHGTRICAYKEEHGIFSDTLFK